MGREPGSERRISYRYRFGFSDGQSADLLLELDYDTLAMLPAPRERYPAWTALGFYQCPNCPLDERSCPRCPIAANLVPVVALLEDRISYEPVEVSVESEGRRYSKSTSLQQAAGSLIGIFNVTSGCPILDKLRPMVATHLPFMTPDESTYRMISTYLMSQYFLHRHGRDADLALTGFVAFLEEARETNASFCARLHALGVKDASLNALANLNAMGEIVSLSIEEGELERWERLFLKHWGRD
jgi:hypothetical protein